MPLATTLVCATEAAAAAATQTETTEAKDAYIGPKDMPRPEKATFYPEYKCTRGTVHRLLFVIP